MDGGVWWATVHGVAKRWTRLNNFTSLLHYRHILYELSYKGSPLMPSSIAKK